jgi:hypothetical protein
MTTTAPTPAFAAPLLHLVCHPATPTPVVHRLEATIRANPDGSLGLFYCLRGDIARLRIPEDCAPERMDQPQTPKAHQFPGGPSFVVAGSGNSLSHRALAIALTCPFQPPSAQRVPCA